MQLDKDAYIAKWLEKADKDLVVAITTARLGNEYSEEAGFHCQQAVEKYLKAFLFSVDEIPPRIHDLVKLLDLMRPHIADPDDWFRKAQALNEYAVDLRYPAALHKPEEIEARQLVEMAVSFRSFIEDKLKFPDANAELHKLLKESGF